MTNRTPHRVDFESPRCPQTRANVDPTRPLPGAQPASADRERSRAAIDLERRRVWRPTPGHPPQPAGCSAILNQFERPRRRNRNRSRPRWGSVGKGRNRADRPQAGEALNVLNHCRGRESNPHRESPPEGILSPLRLPFRHPGWVSKINGLTRRGAPYPLSPRG